MPAAISASPLKMYRGAVKVAGVDVVYAGGDGLAQNSNRTGNVGRRPPDHFVAIPLGKLHRGIVRALCGH